MTDFCWLILFQTKSANFINRLTALLCLPVSVCPLAHDTASYKQPLLSGSVCGCQSVSNHAGEDLWSHVLYFLSYFS